MDEREAWRPKIFFSEGPSQGLPEPFPAPTHLRRKERSASNRGALFVPGAHHYSQYQQQGPAQRQPRGPGQTTRGGGALGGEGGPGSWRYGAGGGMGGGGERMYAPRFKESRA